MLLIFSNVDDTTSLTFDMDQPKVENLLSRHRNAAQREEVMIPQLSEEIANVYLEEKKSELDRITSCNTMIDQKIDRLRSELDSENE